MRIARIADGAGGELALVDGATCRRTGIREPLEQLLDDAGLARLASAAEGVLPEPLRHDLLLPPVAPRVVVGVGLNYRAHAAEQGRALPAEPPLFLKNARSVASPYAALPLHPASGCLDYEAELGVVIGREIFDATAEQAEAAIAGWVVMQDYTLRDLVKPETLTIAKGGLAMAPIGPWLTTVATLSVKNAADLAIRCGVNGDVRQDASTADMHFSPVELVQRISRFLPLGPGDVIATGSPGGSGVGFHPPRWLAAGDVVETEIAGLGRIVQHVVKMC